MSDTTSPVTDSKLALVVDDDPQVRHFVAEVLRADGWQVSEAESAELAFEMPGAPDWSLVFCDVMLGGADGFAVLRRLRQEQPGARIVLMTGHGSAAGALDATALGAYDYLLKPFSVHDVMEISQAACDRAGKNWQAEGEEAAAPAYISDLDLIGKSPALVKVMKTVGRMAATSLPVLITGESGTGKEVVARAIHRRSERADRPFVAINCGAIPAELIESELFGHVRGAFTGAHADRAGLWEEADGGTVFLDEITETTPAFQVKLLRALQEGEIRRVGSNRPLRVNVRVTAATNRDPKTEVREGRFRQDLFYRLNAVNLYLPPLRERREDILPLVRHFAGRVRPQGGTSLRFSREAVRLFEEYPWPGNVRELEYAVMHAASLCDHTVRPEDLPEDVRNGRAAAADGPAQPTQARRPPAAEEWLPLSEVERRYVSRVLAHTGGNKLAAARMLGIDRKRLGRLIRRYDIGIKDAADPS
jgi:two-component system, NtrC family, response regulator AtoC